MFWFEENQNQGNLQVETVTCVCGAGMSYQGEHGIRVGGLTGLMGAGAAMLGGQLADDAEEALEKKMKVGIYVCPQCQDVRFKYRGGL